MLCRRREFGFIFGISGQNSLRINIAETATVDLLFVNICPCALPIIEATCFPQSTFVLIGD